jgi:F-type H+-transporting ATPase subunit b
LVLLFGFAYKPIMRMLDERSNRIKESMEQAERIKEETARAEEMVKAQIEVGRKEGQAIVAQASQVGERVKEEARQEARKEVESLIARAQAEIEREREEAIEQLRQEFVDLALLAAERVINKSLDREVHRRLIEQVLEEDTLKKS